MAESYEPKNELSLWWLGNPAAPQRVGTIMLLLGGRGVGLRYAQSWLASGFALSEDLPLAGDLYLPPERDQAAGAVDDARPDRWGERVIRKFESSSRLSLLEYLLFAGGDRYGALGVSQELGAYVPWPGALIPSFDQMADIAEVVRKVLANEPVPELQKRLLRPGASLGGARPKSLVQIDGKPWIVKFSEGEDMDTPLVEHASMSLARSCGIACASTRAIALGQRHAVAVERFDRRGADRVHAVSANVALRAAGEELGYPQLAQLLRRMAPAKEFAAQQAQLFRRMVFNILIDNTDDHEKNHALLRDPDGNYRLAPAFDVLPTVQGLGYQQMIVGDAGAESTLANALTHAGQFSLNKDGAASIISEVATGVAAWKEHFAGCGVRATDVDEMAQYIDGERLLSQRREFERDAPS